MLDASQVVHKLALDSSRLMELQDHFNQLHPRQPSGGSNDQSLFNSAFLQTSSQNACNQTVIQIPGQDSGKLATKSSQNFTVETKGSGSASASSVA